MAFFLLVGTVVDDGGTEKFRAIQADERRIGMATSSFMMKYCQKDQPRPPYSCGQCAASQLAPTFCVKLWPVQCTPRTLCPAPSVSFQPCGSSAFKIADLLAEFFLLRDQLKSMTVLLASTCLWPYDRALPWRGSGERGE